MWEQEETTFSIFNSDGERERGSNWYYKINQSKYIVSLVWTSNFNTWQICVSDKKKPTYTHRFYEDNLDVAKLKGIVKARQLGWNVEVV